MLGRTAARRGVLGRLAAAPCVTTAAVPASAAAGGLRCFRTSAPRFGDYNWNEGVPGSRIRNPSPATYDDVYPGMGRGWWTLVITAFLSFFWSQWYDLSRPVCVSIGIFGPNMPM